MPTIKVPQELHSRLASLAEAEGTTMAGVITRSLEVAQEAEFWRAVELTMAPADVSADAEKLAGSLADGLDPDESWDEIL